MEGMRSGGEKRPAPDKPGALNFEDLGARQDEVDLAMDRIEKLLKDMERAPRGSSDMFESALSGQIKRLETLVGEERTALLMKNLIGSDTEQRAN